MLGKTAGLNGLVVQSDRSCETKCVGEGTEVSVSTTQHAAWVLQHAMPAFPNLISMAELQNNFSDPQEYVPVETKTEQRGNW